MATICVEVAVLDDRRLLDALDSLAAQTRPPDRILIAASTATPESLLDEARRRQTRIPVEIARFDGGVVSARAGSLPLLREETTVFLDSDERAPPEWLAAIVAPVESGAAAFAGGPTRPLRSPVNSIERYYALLEESIYADLVPRSISYIPLQNTAWRTSVLRSVGFDPRISFAEDHDLESRAARTGAHGVFVPAAFVYHDKSDETSLLRWARKRYRYLVAMAMSLMKNGHLRDRLEERRRPVRHPLRYLESAMKPIALLHASIRWRRLRGATDG
ncbi:MAG: glycosyltransferase family 2 protein [Thermoplasmata archaeon]|nr:glycosyltransferase family 2 protein [Thermoplasmata archaeon]